MGGLSELGNTLSAVSNSDKWGILKVSFAFRLRKEGLYILTKDFLLLSSSSSCCSTAYLDSGFSLGLCFSTLFGEGGHLSRQSSQLCYI